MAANGVVCGCAILMDVLSESKLGSVVGSGGVVVVWVVVCVVGV